jgi:CubicO group peptidase (beta-lactamase class C family)
MPLYATCRDEEEVAARLLGGEWLRDDAEETYSDLDYILWALTAERALGAPYWELLRRFVVVPLGGSGFAATPAAGAAALPCALPTGREVELARGEGLTIAELPAPARGEAQDGNSRFFGRPLGHAGVFATLPALWRLAREWSRPGRLLSREMVDSALAGAGRFALGWYRRGERAAGRRLGEAAFGHDGFTGGALWIDPESGLVWLALAHRASLGADLDPARAALTGELAASGGSDEF